MTALYRKYRPQDFDEVVGQEAVVRTLRNAIERDQIRQTYLLAGPRGTGKTSLARILEWDFDRYIAIHGDPGNMQAQGSKADVENILAWARTPPESTSA